MNLIRSLLNFANASLYLSDGVRPISGVKRGSASPFAIIDLYFFYSLVELLCRRLVCLREQNKVNNFYNRSFFLECKYFFLKLWKYFKVMQRQWVRPQ